MGPIQNLTEALSWLRRRWRIMMLMTVIGTLAGLLMALQTERLYSASAVIQVINPVIVATTEDGTGAAAPDVTRRVQMIEQRLMSREALVELAQRYDLFADSPLSPVEQVAQMRQNFSIASIAAAQQGFTRDGSLSALIVSASDGNPVTAAAIANELADALVQQSVDARQSNTQQALDFFRNEEARLEAGIEQLEAEIAAYRSVNEAFLPDAITLRREEQGRLAEELLTLQQQISARRNERDSLDARSQRAVTQRQVALLNEQIGQLTRQGELISARIAEIQILLQTAPEYQQQLIALNRRMEQLQTQLAAAADRRREAALGAQIEVDQQAERFELLERALVPEHPVSRSRKKVAALGIIAGLMLGVMLAYAQEWRHPVLRSAARMERELQLRPVISIAYALPRREIRRRQLIWAFGGIVLAAGVVTFLAVSGVI